MSSFLQEYQRQPKLFIDLPSKGVFYNGDIIEYHQFTSMPVFGMNAMDEIIFKTPDALFSGEATAHVMNSCIPFIKDPWSIVGYDIDYILISIRIATYGDAMPITTSCPHCSERNESEVSLTKMLENFANCPVHANFEIGDLKINLRPITYKQNTDFSMENFQFERQLLTVNDNKELNKDEKEKLIQQIFVDSSKLNLRLAVAHIDSIESANDKESDQTEILNFIQNNDSEFYSKLRNGIKDLTDKWNLPNIQIMCGNEECGKTYSTALELDYSNFFGTRSLNSRSLIL